MQLTHVSQPITEPKSKALYMLPGEEADLSPQNRNVREEHIKNPSPMRQKVVCPIFYACGGCDLLHIKYEEQLKLKQSYVMHLFSSLNYHQEIPILKSEQMLNYRHKVVLSATTVNKKLKLGLYRENSKEVIPYLNCFLHDVEANDLLVTIEQVMNQFKIPAYDINTHQGILKHVFIRKSYTSKDIMLVFVTQGNLLPNSKKMIQIIRSKHPRVKTVIQNIHHKHTHLVLLENEKILFGKGFIIDQIDDLKFVISSRSFYQINPKQMMSLYQTALDMLDIKEHETIIDTYSGIATLSLLAAKKAKHVYAVEVNAKAHHDAILNKKENNIDNITMINQDVETYMIEHQGHVDGLIMDPTREGSTPSFLKALIKLKPKRVVYISCNPETQVRDLKQLKDNYNILKVKAVDMFSQTDHVETIALLSLNTL